MFSTFNPSNARLSMELISFLCVRLPLNWSDTLLVNQVDSTNKRDTTRESSSPGQVKLAKLSKRAEGEFFQLFQLV